MALLSFLDRDHSIAPAGFNRWRVPPAALAIHLSIGQAYAFSVFNLPLSRLHGLTESAPDDWKLTTIGWIFSIAIVCLGLSAFTFGRWLEQAGPRKAMFAAACCFGGGFVVAALGVQLHAFWLVVPRLRRDRRHWAGARLHLAGVDAHQVVPRPAGDGDRVGDHGVRRRGDDRLAARRGADGAIS